MKDKNLVVLAGGISSRMKKPVNNVKGIDNSLIHDADNKTKSMIGVGDGNRPFLDYLLFNARESNYKDILIVIGENDNSIRDYYGEKDKNNEFYGLNISYAIQKIPKDRVKPLGTADALESALISKPDWHGQKFTVCNSDNLYSQKALTMMLNSPYLGALIDYDRSALEFELSRIEAFAVTKKNEEGFLIDIIEKPNAQEIESVIGDDGIVGVSMNLFRLDYNTILPILKEVPMNPQRQEKDLPEAVKILSKKLNNSVYSYPLAEHVPDLTNKSDILAVQEYLNKYFPDFGFNNE